MSVHKSRPEHEVLYQDLCKLVATHGDSISAAEMLAVAANMLGKLMAMQDQRTMTSEIAMEIVILNLQAGNQQMVDQITNSKGSA